MSDLSSENKQFFAVLALLIAIKAVGLAVYGPIFLPESVDFTRYADILISNGSWLTNIGLDHELWGATSFRSIGYPLVIAFSKILSTSAWPWIVVGLQFFVSLIASAFVYRLTKALSGLHWIGLLAAFCHGTGQVVVLDQTIFPIA